MSKEKKDINEILPNGLMKHMEELPADVKEYLEENCNNKNFGNVFNRIMKDVVAEMSNVKKFIILDNGLSNEVQC